MLCITQCSYKITSLALPPITTRVQERWQTDSSESSIEIDTVCFQVFDQKCKVADAARIVKVSRRKCHTHGRCRAEATCLTSSSKEQFSGFPWLILNLQRKATYCRPRSCENVSQKLKSCKMAFNLPTHDFLLISNRWVNFKENMDSDLFVLRKDGCGIWKYLVFFS
jgi:hypothetical protein